MEITRTNPPLSEEQLHTFEQHYKLTLPAEYRRFLLEHNGGSPHPNTIDFIERGRPNSSDIHVFYGLHDGESWSRLDSHLSVFQGRIVDEGLAIAGDSGGNQYVLIHQGEKSGQVYFWDHETESEPPSYDNMSLIAHSFQEFIEKIYEFVLPAETEPQRIMRQGDLPGLHALLAAGYDIETINENNRTLLEEAVIYQRAEMIRLLLDRGAHLRNALPLARYHQKLFDGYDDIVVLLEERS